MLQTWTFKAKGFIAPMPCAGFATPALFPDRRSNSIWIQEIDENDRISTFLEIDQEAAVAIDYDEHVVLELKVGRPASYAYRDESGAIHVGSRAKLSGILETEYEHFRGLGSQVFLRSEIAQFLRVPHLIEESRINLDLYRVNRDRVLYAGSVGRGIISRLTDRGFGFISPEGFTKDIFFHTRELKGISYRDLKEGDVVTFDITDTDRGLAAANVQRA